MSKTLLRVTLQALNLFFVVICLFGVLLIIYGVLWHQTEKAWPVLDQNATILSSMATFISLGITALSIYFPSTLVRKPVDLSRFITAPAIAVGALVGCYYVLAGQNLSPHIANGAGLLALGGALFRLLPPEPSAA